MGKDKRKGGDGLTFATMGAQAAKEAKATTKEVAIFILNDWVARVYHWSNCAKTDKTWSRDESKSEVGLGIAGRIYVSSGRLMVSPVPTHFPFQTGLQDELNPSTLIPSGIALYNRNLNLC